MTTEKLPNKRYLRIHDEQFKEWIREVLKEEKMKYAKAPDVAEEIERLYGGVATSHMHKIRHLRLDIEEFRPKAEK